MSTKTTFKRIALVAVAALGLGVMSVAPSQAVVSGLTVGTTNGSTTTDNSYSDTSTSAVVEVAFLNLTQLDSVTVTAILKSAPSGATNTARLAKLVYMDTRTSIGTTGASSTVGIGAVGAGSTTRWTTYVAPESATGFTLIPSGAGIYAGGKFYLNLDTRTATSTATAATILEGSYTYTIVATPYSANPSSGISGPGTPVTKDVSIVVGKATADVTTVAAASSTAFLGAATGASADEVITSVSTASTTAVGIITVLTYNASGNPAPESITATITGAGLLRFGGVAGNSLTIAGDGTTDIEVLANGVAGVGTITVSTTSSAFAPKTVTFYAAAAKTLTAAVNNPVLRVGANSQAVVVSAVDANGTNWAGDAYIVASAAADALVGGSATTPVGCEYNSTYKVHYCPVTTIATGTAKFKVIDASTVALATATSNEVTVTVSNAAATSLKVAFDKATYAPFEKALIWVTVVDKDGNALQGKTYANLYATGGIASNVAFTAGGAADLATASATTSEFTLASSNLYAGAKTYVVYMPAQGDLTVSVTGGTSLAAAGQIAYSATASIVNSSVDAATDAANEATDAANAATDAALAAADSADAATEAAQEASDAVAELSTQVAALMASLKAQIKSLTNLVIKIQKKLK